VIIMGKYAITNIKVPSCSLAVLRTTIRRYLLFISKIFGFRTPQVLFDTLFHQIPYMGESERDDREIEYV